MPILNTLDVDLVKLNVYTDSNVDDAGIQ